MKLLPIHRVSSTGQAGEDGEGLDRQRTSTAAVAKAHGATLLPPVEIWNVSGGDLNKTSEWRDRVLPAVQDPDTHVVVDAIDRILRADAFNFQVMQDLLASGTYIFTPGKVHDLAQPEDGFLAGLFALLGGREKAEIKRRMMAGREACRRRGEWPLKQAALPRGITYDPATKAWGYNQPEADVIKYVFDQFVTYRLPHRAIARSIGKPMQTIAQYLKNPIYKGLLRFDEKRGTELYPGKNGRQGEKKKVKRAPSEIIEVRVFGAEGQPGQLVSDQVWQAAQDILRVNSIEHHKRHEKSRPDSWASGFLVSAFAPRGEVDADGFYDLVPRPHEKRHTIYVNGGAGQLGTTRYSCRCGRSQDQEKYKMTRCGFRNPLAPTVNATVDAFLVDLTSEDWFFSSVRSALTAPKDDTLSRAILEKKLSDLREREGRLTDLFLDGRVAREKHDRAQDAIRAEIEQVRADLSKLRVVVTPTVVDLNTQARDWRWNPEWDHVQKRAWLSKWVQEIYLSNEGVEGASVRVVAGDGTVTYGTGYQTPWVGRVFSRKAPVRNRTAG